MIGEAILHYLVLDQMGAGGMGVVYRARDTRLGRHVALKFLPEATRLDESARERLIAEAQAAARLDHPNIGVIHAIEDADDRPFIVMALYEGESLRSRIDRAPLSPEEAADITGQVALGLARAHDSGVVHRDIKPDNLFLAPQGIVKILDFGLAKLDRMDNASGAGTLIGTLAYMSPEQLRGQAVDARTDLWALGVVLYEMLTGISPFHTESGMTASILKIIKDDPEPIAQLRPDINPYLANVVERALVKNRDVRYATAADLLLDLAAARRQGPTPRPAPPTSVIAPAPATITTATETGSAAPIAPARPALHVVPTVSTPIVGREDELSIIATNLDDPHCRVLTLFGQGGTGKTRLATEAARQAVERGTFADGVVFVSLDTLNDPELIPQAIARGLGSQLQPNEPALDQVVRAIGERSLLIVLDNYEHVMDGAQLPADLVAGCPGLRVLVTSRERLNLEEEWVLPLPGLTIPAEGTTDHEAIERCEAVQLFVHRAKRARQQFSLEDEGATHVGHICRLVAGSPLGIELAASWVKMMACDEIAREIQGSIDFLTSSSRNVSERHRSIRACFGYSWTLLSNQEQDALARLATFHGSFTRDAAAAVAGARLPVLMTLVDKSLLKADGKRYESHSLLRQYAAEKLAEDPARRAEVEARHGEFFKGFVGAVRGEEDQLSKLDRELPEILTALQRADARGDAAMLVTMMRGLAVDGPYYAARGHTPRSLELLQAAIAGARTIGDLDTAHRLLGKLGDSHRLQHGRADPALEAYREALAIAERLGDHHRESIMLSLIGQTRFEQGADDAQGYLERAYALAREHGDGVALNHVLQHQGFHAGHRGDWETAQRLFSEALAALEGTKVQDQGSEGNVAYQRFMALLNLGEAERMLGSHQAALDLRQRGLRMAEERDNQVWRAYALQDIGEVYHSMGDRSRAQTHFSEALTLWEQQHVEVKVQTLRLFLQQEGYEVGRVAGVGERSPG